MFSEKDIQYKTVLFVNATDGRSLSVHSGMLNVSDTSTGETVCRLAFQKTLAVFIIGRCTVTSPLLDALTRHAVPLCILKESLRPLLWKAEPAEGNYLLRRKQYAVEKDDIRIAKRLVTNKALNQIRLLERIPGTERAVQGMRRLLEELEKKEEYNDLLASEAMAAKTFFRHWFATLRFPGRKPRMKCDPVNVALDIGYTVLFNYVEANLRLFGFDVYIGVCHRLFFKRKSLVCDMVEPFRCIIDLETRDAFSSRVFRKQDFEEKDGIFILKKDKAFTYYKTYASAVLDRKMEIFRFIRDYYRAFMKGTDSNGYPVFLI